VTLCGWEGNRWSGIALAMHHGLSGLSTYGFNNQRIREKHIAYAPDGAWPGLPLFNHSTGSRQSVSQSVPRQHKLEARTQ